MVIIMKYTGTLLPLLVMMASCSGEFIELSQYHRMPRLAETDDYDQCMQDTIPGEISTYCMARVVIKPDNTSDLWNLIEEFSNHRKKHHNHALLERGVCMNECKKLVERLPEATRQALRVQKFPIKFPYIHDTTILEDSVTDRATYGELVDICVNYKLNESYRLSAYTEIESCSKNNETQHVDLLDISFLVVLAVLILLVVLSSWYDQTINCKQDANHYKHDLDNKKKMLFVTFSIARNWCRLTSHSQEALHKDLRFFQGARLWGMCIVMFGHISVSFQYLALQNVIGMEMGNHSIFSIILTEGNRTVQTFFIMGGFLLAVIIKKHAESHTNPLGIVFVLKAILLRYIRLTPVYAFIILLHATWLSKLQDGPWWKIRLETERSLCRKNWWTNMLYINNYNDMDQHCILPTWYLGCDFQLFILGCLLLVAITRFRRFVASILTVAVVVSVLVPAFFIYYDKLDGTPLITLQNGRFFFMFDDLHIKSYTSLQLNLGNYLIGIIAAIIYLHLKKAKTDLSKNKWFCIVWYLLFPICFSTLLLNSIFYENDFEKPSLWMAVFFPLSKYSWGFCICWVMIGLIFGVLPVMKRFLSPRIFEPLGRLTYCAYLAHMFIIKATLYNIRTPIHGSLTGTITTLTSTVVLSYMMALALCLLLELPTSALQKFIFGNMKGNYYAASGSITVTNTMGFPIQMGLSLSFLILRGERILSSTIAENYTRLKREAEKIELTINTSKRHAEPSTRDGNNHLV